MPPRDPVDIFMEGFEVALADFIAERPIAAASVQLLLVTDEKVMVAGMRRAPIPGMVSVDAYPKNMSTMVTRTDDVWAGIKTTPTRMLIPMGRIARIDLMVQAPGLERMGFSADSDDQPGATRIEGGNADA